MTQKEVRAKYYQDLSRRKRKLGLCLKCSAKSVDGKVYCQKHLTYLAGKMRGIYTQRKAAGLCPKCGQPTGRKVACMACRAKRLVSTVSAVVVCLCLAVSLFAQAPASPTNLTAIVQPVCKDPCTDPLMACYKLPTNLRPQLTWTSPADMTYRDNGWGTLITMQGPVAGQEWLEAGIVGSQYCRYIRAGGGKPPYIFSVDFLPAGLRLDSSSGLISGVALGPSLTFMTFTVKDMLGTMVTIQRSMETCYPEGPCGLFGTAPPTRPQTIKTKTTGGEK